MPVIIKVNMTAKEITTVENPDYKLLGGRALRAGGHHHQEREMGDDGLHDQ